MMETARCLRECARASTAPRRAPLPRRLRAAPAGARKKGEAAGGSATAPRKPFFVPDESKRVEKVDTKGLEAAILKAHGEGGVPLIIDFYAHWCGPCMVLGRTLDKLAVAMGDAVDIVKVDVEEEKRLADDLEVAELPTIVFVPADKYRAVTRTEGMLPAQVIIECLQEDAGLEIPDDWTGYEHLPQVDYRDRQS